MTNVYEFLFAIFVLILIFGALGIGYLAGREREFNTRKRVCDDIKRQTPNCSEEWLNGAMYVISRLNELTDTDDDAIGSLTASQSAVAKKKGESDS